MKPKIIAKIMVDIGMTFLLLFLMPYELIGQSAHEWMGVGIFVLFVIHHLLNAGWSRNLFKGRSILSGIRACKSLRDGTGLRPTRYTLLRIVQTALVFGALVSILGSMISGMMLSRHVFLFLPVRGRRSSARKLHMLSGYWGFVLMALHLGFHWSMMMGIAGKLVKKPSVLRTRILRLAALAVAVYGVFAFVRRDIGSYMLLNIQFVFFDFEEPLVFFILDYMAVMGLFVVIGHYVTEVIKKGGVRWRKTGTRG